MPPCAGSDNPVTSFTASAPASSAALATDAFAGVNRDNHACRRQLRHHRLDPPQLLDRIDRIGSGTGRFAADVHQVGALLPKLETAPHRGVGIGITAPVGEGVGGDVEDPHYGDLPGFPHEPLADPPGSVSRLALATADPGLLPEEPASGHSPPAVEQRESLGAGGGLSAKMPRTAEVTVIAPGLRTPRMLMQRCSASTTTSTPCGSRTSINVSATWAVSRSCICGRRA